MKTTTLWQPWAGFVAWGAKTIETRNYPPPDSVLTRRIGIHAAKRPMDPKDIDYYVETMNEIGRAELHDGDGFPLGAVVATAVLRCSHQVYANKDGQAGISVLPRDCPHYRDRVVSVPIDPYGNFSPGRWLWFLEDVERLYPPVPARGMQGFWEWVAA